MSEPVVPLTTYAFVAATPKGFIGMVAASAAVVAISYQVGRERQRQWTQNNYISFAKNEPKKK